MKHKNLVIAPYPFVYWYWKYIPNVLLFLNILNIDIKCVCNSKTPLNNSKLDIVQISCHGRISMNALVSINIAITQQNMTMTVNRVLHTPNSKSDQCVWTPVSLYAQNLKPFITFITVKIVFTCNIKEIMTAIIWLAVLFHYIAWFVLCILFLKVSNACNYTIVWSSDMCKNKRSGKYICSCFCFLLLRTKLSLSDSASISQSICMFSVLLFGE